MKKIKIDKKNGETRTVYKFNRAYIENQRNLLPLLYKLVDELDYNQIIYGFRPKLNCIANAYRHVGFSYSLRIDIKDFFGSVKQANLSTIPKIFNIDWANYDSWIPSNNGLMQGHPLSPSIANLAMIETDSSIFKELLKVQTHGFCYTRYADDLVVSFNKKSALKTIKEIVVESLNKNGFEEKANKTKFQSLANGRMIITGVAIDEKNIYPTRKTLRRIRAAGHQEKEASLTGLTEWSKCKFPKIDPDTDQTIYKKTFNYPIDVHNLIKDTPITRKLNGVKLKYNDEIFDLFAFNNKKEIILKKTNQKTIKILILNLNKNNYLAKSYSWNSEYGFDKSIKNGLNSQLLEKVDLLLNDCFDFKKATFKSFSKNEKFTISFLYSDNNNIVRKINC